MNDTPNPVAYPPVHDIWQLIARDTINGWDDAHLAFSKLLTTTRAHHDIASAHWRQAHTNAARAVCRAAIALGVPTPDSAYAEANL